MTKQTLGERATAGLQRLAKERGRGFQRRLADAAHIPPSSLTRVLRGDQPVTLAILDAVAEIDTVNPLSLLAGTEDELRVVSGPQATLLRYTQQWPPSVTAALVKYLDHFAAEPPVERELRNGLTLLRELNDRQRSLVLGYMLMLREGIPRDLEVALNLPPAGTGPGGTGSGGQRGGKPNEPHNPRTRGARPR